MRVAVIPAHDESANVADVVRRALPHVDVVLVIDDGSSDDTASLAEAAGAKVERLVPNRGKGGALRYGLETACAMGATQLVTLDADGEHFPEEIPALLGALADADVSLGHRAVYRSGSRRAANALALFFFRLLDPAVRDTICGFRAFRREAVPVVQNDCGGFVYEHEAILRAVAAGLRIASVPVSTTPSTRSHVTAREMLRANNHFDRRVLELLPKLPIPLWRRAILAVGCAAGISLGAPAALMLGQGARR